MYQPLKRSLVAYSWSEQLRPSWKGCATGHFKGRPVGGQAVQFVGRSWRCRQKDFLQSVWEANGRDLNFPVTIVVAPLA